MMCHSLLSHCNVLDSELEACASLTSLNIDAFGMLSKLLANGTELTAFRSKTPNQLDPTDVTYVFARYYVLRGTKVMVAPT
jgi:hypothetical protein